MFKFEVKTNGKDFGDIEVPLVKRAVVASELQQIISGIAYDIKKGECLGEILETDTKNVIGRWSYYPDDSDAYKPKIITLCGSTRFKDDFIEEQKTLTLMGFIVISVGLFGHIDMPEMMETDTKVALDELHKRKIDISDIIYVIDKDGYIGEITRGEIEYASSKGKIVRYMSEERNKKEIREKLFGGLMI